MNYHHILPTLFAEIKSTYASRPALKYEDNSYTYEQLDSGSSLVACAFMKQGIKRGDVVAIFNSKEYVSFVVMMACLKIGAIYTCLDHDAPKEWCMHILDVCQPKKILSDRSLAPHLSNGPINIEIIDNNFLEQCRIATQDISYVPQQFDGDTIAYIMFTSGSTGRPKGVAISHQNLLHFIHWSVTKCQITSSDIFANVSPIYFDNSVFDFYTAFFSGASISPVKKEIVNDPKRLLAYLDQIGPTIWFSVPSLLIYLMITKVLNKNSFSKIRLIMFGGEGYPLSELKKLFDLFKHRTRFINVYGPTECTCICSSYDISDNDFSALTGLPPLGHINTNVSYLVLNESNQEDLTGELCLLGPNVARGYYNDFDKTEKSFFYYTGDGHYQTKMYRTGDLVRMQNGLLYFVGRKDNQIKHMGHRIELEAIEAVLGKLKEVCEVAVLYIRKTAAYGKIVAFIAVNETTGALELKEQLKDFLPEYMVPNQFIFLDHLPKNANGKIDKMALNNMVVSSQDVA